MFVIIRPFLFVFCLSDIYKGSLWTHKAQFITMQLHYTSIRHQTLGRLLVPPGIVWGNAAGLSVPRWVLPFPDRCGGLSDRFDGTVGVCLKLIPWTWLRLTVGVFPPRLSRQKRHLSLVFRYAFSVCVSAFPEEMHKNDIAVSLFILSWNLLWTEMMSFVRAYLTVCSPHGSFMPYTVYREYCSCCQPQWILSFPLCVSVSLKRLSAHLLSTRNTTCRNFRVLFSLQSTQAGSLPQCSVTISAYTMHHFQPDSWLQM